MIQLFKDSMIVWQNHTKIKTFHILLISRDIAMALMEPLYKSQSLEYVV